MESILVLQHMQIIQRQYFLHFTINASGSAVNNNLRVSQPQVGVSMGQQSVLPPLTNYSLQAVRQVVDDSNHDMVNMMTQQIGNAINPLINHTNNSNQQLATQMGRIADFFGGPQPQIRPLPIIQHVEVNPNEGIPNIGGVANNPIQQQPIVQQQLKVQQQPIVQQPLIQQPVVQQPIQQAPVGGAEGNVGRNNINVFMVQRNQHPDQVVRRVQQNNLGGKIILQMLWSRF